MLEQWRSLVACVGGGRPEISRIGQYGSLTRVKKRFFRAGKMVARGSIVGKGKSSLVFLNSSVFWGEFQKDLTAGVLMHITRRAHVKRYLQQLDKQNTDQ